MSKPAKSEQEQEPPEEILPGRRTFIVIVNHPLAAAAHFFEGQYPERPEDRFANAFRTRHLHGRRLES